jgi:excinuclease UvrABC ATPase subunit
MGRQIIKQPNGKYCIFSSVVDNVTFYDMSVEDIIEEWVDEARKNITEKVESIVLKIENNENPYFQFTKSYDEMIEDIERNHGKKESKKIKLLIETPN